MSSIASSWDSSVSSPAWVVAVSAIESLSLPAKSLAAPPGALAPARSPAPARNMDPRRIDLYVVLPQDRIPYSGCQARLSGNIGSTTRPKVELITAANDAYHAAIAVKIPNQPPSLIVPLVVAVPPASAEFP